jgi:hypothetical protein
VAQRAGQETHHERGALRLVRLGPASLTCSPPRLSLNHVADAFYGAIIGDVRRGGGYSSYQADLIVRMPKKELQAVLIKQQHNVTSNGRDYPLRMPRIMHEYVILWQRRQTITPARQKPNWVANLLKLPLTKSLEA